jgi:hypothetical protein
VTDVEYLGPDNALGNFSYWSSTDGSCSGEPDIISTYAIVKAADLDAAQTVCASIARLGFSGNAFNIQGAWPSLPDTAWGCTG